ncbi:MAG: hypothetical protein J5849_05645, partial [Clostridia bacterium]|nr:hypothetical protein [Clostridia bacterium]
DGGEIDAGDGAITLRLRKYGVYTLLFGTDQEHAFTLFVRPFSDEEKEIAALRAELGEENVRVLEPGIHTDAHLSFDRDGSVLYMKAGAILLPEHTLDILSDKDAAEKSEEGALAENALGLNRYPVINACGKKDVRVLGRGTVDMTGLDWHERRGAVFSLCDGVELSDLIVINPCEWATIFYRSENVSVRRCAVFGWKTNSDAFAVCNSRNARVTDSFARSGDDLFEVKTLGGPEDASAGNVTFARCQAWGGKARCFGVTGEIEREIDGVLFEDSAVLVRDATWDNDRIGSLVVIRETGTGEVKNVIFRNMTVWYDAGRAINCAVYAPEIAGSRIFAVFEKIVCRAGMEARCEGRTDGGNAMEIVFRKVTVNGERITKENLGEKVLLDDPAIARAE